jgi:hypothetical protein
LDILINDPGQALQNMWVCGTIIPNPSNMVATPPMALATTGPKVSIQGVRIASLFPLGNLTELAVVAEDSHGGTNGYTGGSLDIFIDDVRVTGRIDKTKVWVFKGNSSAMVSVFNATVSGCSELKSTPPKNGAILCTDTTASASIAYSASVTPDPSAYRYLYIGPLTGDISIVNPSATVIAGQQLVLSFLCDATASRTITYGSAFKTSAVPVSTSNGKLVHCFTYDGTHWVQNAGSVAWL